MGLDTSHGCWHGPYSSFSRFRQMLAKLIGMDLNRMAGFQVPKVSNSHHFITNEMPIEWSDIPQDDLHILLNHSDCDGTILNEDCLPLATRLQELIPLIEDSHFKQKTYQFVEGLLDAHHLGEDVDFH